MSTNWERIGTAAEVNRAAKSAALWDAAFNGGRWDAAVPGTPVSSGVRREEAQPAPQPVKPPVQPVRRVTTGQKVAAVGELIKVTGQLLTLIVWGGFGLLLLCGGLYLVGQFILAAAAAVH